MLPFSRTWRYGIVLARWDVWQAPADAGRLPQRVRTLHQTYRNRPFYDTPRSPERFVKIRLISEPAIAINAGRTCRTISR
jgi:hypothetical protein